MARIVKDADVRQAEILDAAFALFMQHGYEATSIQQLIDAIGIAKGTFYHHYRSKTALLDALIERFTEQGMAVARPIVEDPELGALDKLNTLFHTIGQWKATQREFLLPVLIALRLPQNVPLREGMERRSMESFTPLVARILAEGMEQGVFDVYDPELAARILFGLQLEVGNLLGDLILSEDKQASMEQAGRLLIAHDQAVARILGAPEGSFHMVEDGALATWFR